MPARASDMGVSSDSQASRPVWGQVAPGLKAQFAREYRSPDFDEEKAYAKYVELIPAEAILDFLEREEATCHRQAHELGRAVMRKFNDINKALAVCGNGCTNACMHGAVGEAFSDDPHQHDGHHTDVVDSAALVEKMESFCRQGEMASLHKRGNCAHAMGHALMLKMDHDIGVSLAACARFGEAGMDYYCATGVYMQYMDNVSANGLRAADVERRGANYPCNTFTAYPAACYRYIVSEVKEERGLGLEHLVLLCRQLPADARLGCFHGLGATYTPLLKLYPDMLKVVCSYGGRDELVLCIEGAIEKLADFDERAAAAACETLIGEAKAVCIVSARDGMYQLDKPSMKLYRAGMQR